MDGPALGGEAGLEGGAVEECRPVAVRRPRQLDGDAGGAEVEGGRRSGVLGAASQPTTGTLNPLSASFLQIAVVARRPDDPLKLT